MAPREPDEDGLEEELIDDPQMNLGDQWGMKRMLDEKAIVRSQPLPLLCVQASVRVRAAELRAAARPSGGAGGPRVRDGLGNLERQDGAGRHLLRVRRRGAALAEHLARPAAHLAEGVPRQNFLK